MEELKTEELEQVTKTLQNTNNIKTNVELINNETQKNHQGDLLDKTEKNSQSTLIDETEKNSQSTLIDETEKNPQSTLIDETKKNSQEVKIETPSESIEIKTEDANTTNCLALTIQEDHKLVAFKNIFFRSIRMSWKVVVSTITLALIKLFS